MNMIVKTKGGKALCSAAAFFLTIVIILSSAAVYAADSSFRLTVSQIFNTSSVSADSAFTYRLKPLDPNNPMPGGSTPEGYLFTIKGTGSAEIGPLTCTKQGVYRYELFQEVGTAKQGYTYDRQVYTVEVHADAALNTQVIIYKNDGTKAENIVFKNSYGLNPTNPGLMYDPPVKKTVFGIPNYNATFTFKLQAQDSSYPMPPGSTNGVKTIRITGSGSGSFGVWSYERTGTYYYTVYEVNDMVNGYTYDTAVYIITDMVKEENGVLVLTRIVTNSMNKPVMSLIFNNYYTGYPPPVIIPTTTPTTTVPPVTLPPIHPTTKAPATTASPSVTTKPSTTSPPAVGGGTPTQSIIPTPTQNVIQPSANPPGNTNEPPPKATAVPPETQPVIENATSTTESVTVIPINVGNPGNPGNNYINNNPAPYGPKTGDDMNPAFYTVLLILGGITATGALIYLIIYGKKIKRSQNRI